MADKIFVDTNIICYLFSVDTHKAALAEKILSRSPNISVQVLNETAAVLRKKLNMSWADVMDALGAISGLCITHPITITIHTRGLMLAEKYSLGLYDAMVVSAALESECSILYSEDMQHQQVIEKTLTIINPFKE